MKIYIYGEKYFHILDSIIDTFQILGYEVKSKFIKKFNRSNLNIFEYLYYKQDKDSYVNKFYTQQQNELQDDIFAYNPDIFIAINPNFYFELCTSRLLSNLKMKNIKTIIWYLDSIKRSKNIKQNINYYDKVISFEPNDYIYIYNKYKVKASYLPFGVDTQIFHDYNNDKFKYDISFVGYPTASRLKILEAVASYCYKNNRKMIVYGKYWNSGNFIRNICSKRKFCKQYPNIARYATNELICNDNLARIYNESKICLNIHIDEHKGINPRLLEILGCGSFQLSDYREKTSDLGIVDGENIIFYKSINDCIKKIQYYLDHDRERNYIAKNGAELVRAKYTLVEIIKKILSGFAE